MSHRYVSSEKTSQPKSYRSRGDHHAPQNEPSHETAMREKNASNSAATSATTTTTSTTNPPRRKIVGITERVEMRSRKREERANRPRSWFERKCVIPFVVGIVGYAWYVYIGRVCVPIIRRGGEESGFGGRGMGIAFVIVFCLLGLMFWWTYLALLFTPPGFARDYVQKAPAPQNEYQTHGRRVPSSLRSRGHGFDSENEEHSDGDDFVAGAPYNEMSPSASHQPSNEGAAYRQHHPTDAEKYAELTAPAPPHRTPAPPQPVYQPASPPRHKLSKKHTRAQVLDTARQDGSHTRNLSYSSGGERNTEETAVGSSETNVGFNFRPAPAHPLAKQITPPTHDITGFQYPRNPRSAEDGLPPPIEVHTRRPPSHPVLLPEYRYCDLDGFVKPMRAHHCRICGTCVLGFDHHCPWIGQCVGARNHKYFVNFLEWSTPWTLWIFATLVAREARLSSDPDANLDPQIIVLAALSGLFSLFTGGLLGAHIQMILLNQTSVESLVLSTMRDRESYTLDNLYPAWRIRKRKAIVKQWDVEWGEIRTEGNIWWLGSARANWEHRMGKNWVGWILPVGKSEGDGLTYPTNPRFDKDGRWRRRSEWPPELR